MSRRRKPREFVSKKFHALILASFALSAGILQATVLYAIDDRSVRLNLGLLLLIIVFLAGARLGVVEHAVELVTPPLSPRRFQRLRANVEKLLGEVRRLNGLAVDRERGIRSPEATDEMMDDIEVWLKDHIGSIRDSAGVTTEE